MGDGLMTFFSGRVVIFGRFPLPDRQCGFGWGRRRRIGLVARLPGFFWVFGVGWRRTVVVFRVSFLLFGRPVSSGGLVGFFFLPEFFA